LIHSDEAIERMMHAATAASYHRLLVDGNESNQRSKPTPTPVTASPMQSLALSQRHHRRLLFTPRYERGSQSNPLEDVRYILAEHRGAGDVAGRSDDDAGMTEPVGQNTTASAAAPSSSNDESATCDNVDDNNDDYHDDDDDDDKGDLASFVPWNQPSVLPSYILRNDQHHSQPHHQTNHHNRSHGDSYSDNQGDNQDRAPRIIIYQTRGVYTGGTVALALLAERLHVLG
jgi:hypothetical protein